MARPSGHALARESGGIRTRTQQVADALRERILADQLKPGHRLGREQDLAAEFGVSRPTMREALRLLSAGGLIRSRKGRGGGIFVSRSLLDTLTHSLEDRITTMLDVRAVSLADLMAARVAVELPIVRLAARRITPEALAVLRETIAQIEGAADSTAVIAADRAFHQTIADACDNPVLAATIAWASQVVQPQVYAALPPARLEGVLAEQHQLILDALERHDEGAAAAAMAAHLAHLSSAISAERRIETAAAASADAGA